ncbi:MAG: dibenzothiophene desulfurase, partial [Alphaproteobacteria bacterium]
MIPAVSLIVFSALSGLGFGMMVWLGLGYGPQLGWHVFLACALALGAAAGGLVASLWHLGSPARARFALSQWRSSW